MVNTCGWLYFFLTTCGFVRGQLTLPPERTSGLGCIPVGTTVSYQCTVEDVFGTASTVWLGSAFNCPSSAPTTNDRVSLPHSDYSAGTMAVCGGLTARSTGRANNDYTSTLIFTATTEMNGLLINCTIGALILEGFDSIRTGVRPPSPNSVVVSVDSSSSLTVSWTPPADVSNIGQYLFTVTGDCNCLDTNTIDTSVTCSGWVARNQTCVFVVHSISTECGFLSDTVTETSVFLSVPFTPNNVRLNTLTAESCSFQSSSFTLSWNNQSPESLPHVTLYQVVLSYNDSQAMALLNTISLEESLTIPGSNFSLGAGIYSFIVSAINILGEGPASSIRTTVSLTKLQSTVVRLGEAMTEVTLQFNISNTACVGSSLTVFYVMCSNQENCQCPSNFDDPSLTTTVNSTPINVTLTGLMPMTLYCYRSELINFELTVAGLEDNKMFITQLPSGPPPQAQFAAFILLLVPIVVVCACFIAGCRYAHKRKNVTENLQLGQIGPAHDSATQSETKGGGDYSTKVFDGRKFKDMQILEAFRKYS